jgi:hypothetical protein
MELGTNIVFAQLYWGLEPVACTHGIQKTQTSPNVLEKLTRNASSRSHCKNTEYKMFKELVASQFITELKTGEGKNEAESAPKGLMDALEETSSDGAKLPDSNPCDNAQSRNTDQEQRETNKQTSDLDVAEITASTLDENSCTSNVVHIGSEIRLNNKHISLLPRSFAMTKHTERTFKRITDRVRFVITCRAW